MGNDKLFIAERFRKIVTLHIIKNLLPLADGQVPLILGVHGSPGSGKTYQCECLLNELQVTPFVISGGELESPDAGAPARLIRSVYLQASKHVAEQKSDAAVILINDIDTAIGDFGPLVQYTVNRQMVFVELMNRADYPRMVEGQKTRRIPFIFTGNDFTKLYAPLIRAGRMTAFEWEPSLEETQAVVETIFPSLTPAEVHSLVKRFPTAQIALYSALRSLLLDEQLYGIIRHEGAERVINYLAGGKDLRMNWPITYADVVAKADELVRQGMFVNHLERID